MQRLMTESLHNQRDLQLAEDKVDEQRRFRFPPFPDRQADVDESIALATADDWPSSTYGMDGFTAVVDIRPSSTALAPPEEVEWEALSKIPNFVLHACGHGAMPVTSG